VIHDAMPYDPIQSQGHGGPKVVKMADFTVSPPPISSCSSWQAPLRVRGTKRRHQSLEWTIPISEPQINSLRERLLDFRCCWIVFIHIVRGRPGGLL